jgi:hypothetical protein
VASPLATDEEGPEKDLACREDPFRPSSVDFAPEDPPPNPAGSIAEGYILRIDVLSTAADLGISGGRFVLEADADAGANDGVDADATAGFGGGIPTVAGIRPLCAENELEPMEDCDAVGNMGCTPAWGASLPADVVSIFLSFCFLSSGDRAPLPGDV